jgi:hypothetical protein
MTSSQGSPSPTPVGNRIRMSLTCADVARVTGWYQTTFALTFRTRRWHEAHLRRRAAFPQLRAEAT